MRDADAVVEVVTVVGKPAALAPMDVAVHGILVCVTVDYPVATAPGRFDAEAGANGCVGFDDFDDVDSCGAVAAVAAAVGDCGDCCGGYYCSLVTFDGPKWPAEID